MRHFSASPSPVWLLRLSEIFDAIQGNALRKLAEKLDHSRQNRNSADFWIYIQKRDWTFVIQISWFSGVFLDEAIHSPLVFTWSPRAHARCLPGHEGDAPYPCFSSNSRKLCCHISQKFTSFFSKANFVLTSEILLHHQNRNVCRLVQGNAFRCKCMRDVRNLRVHIVH